MLINFNYVQIFVTIRGKTRQLQSRNCQNRNLSPLKFDIYFWFVSETIGVDLTTFLSHMQYLVKIGRTADIIVRQLICSQKHIHRPQRHKSD